MEHLINFGYLIAAGLFIVGLKLQQKVPTARNGNALSGLGMLLAVVLTLVGSSQMQWAWILGGIVVGSAIGLIGAYRVKMTAMPQMVAILNGLGGGASLLVALAYTNKGELLATQTGTMTSIIGAQGAVSLMLSVIIGAITFSGSVVAFLKLQELISGRPITLPGRHFINMILALAAIGSGIYIAFFAPNHQQIDLVLWVLTALVLLLGVLLVLPIGGADMPVVISLLNSYSGIAAAMTGFVLSNNLLIITGSLVGASGIILTRIMCKAMNRSLVSVLLGGFGATESGTQSQGEYKNITQAGIEEAAMLLDSAQSVIFVPGYGLAVAQAQHSVRDLADLLTARGVNVKYAIHPVAGRMPGHMNVLLADANVPYEQLYEMERINNDFKTTDVAVVLGANDVVNPAAANDPSSPIFGMPILKVHEARTVLVVKRSLGAGFAGIKNDLFEADNTLMVFADAKKMLEGVAEELRNQ